MDKIMSVDRVILISWAVGVMTIPVLRYVLERFGGPVWQDIKKVAYKIWDAVKSPFKK